MVWVGKDRTAATLRQFFDELGTYGYRSLESLIAMADLTRGGLCPPLPGRSRESTHGNVSRAHFSSLP